MSCNKWQLCFLYLCNLVLHRFRKNERVAFLSLSCSVQGKKTCLIPGRFSTFKVNAYYVCLNTEYRWLKGYGKQIPLKKVVFLLHVSNQNKCNIWDLEWKSSMRYGVYACIVDSWLLKLSVCWTRSIFWIKSDFFDAIHKA